VRLLQEMKRHSVRPNNAASSACEKDARPEHALQLLQDMQRSGVQPDVISYNALIR
jgi:pentatricopeptide repeat protein